MNSIQQWLDKRPDRRSKLANRSLYLAAFVATTLFGGSLFAMMLYVSASATPQSVLLLLRAPFKGGFNFFVIFNSLMEWVFLPAILFLNWHIPNRKIPLLVGASLYYLARCWTYVYFVPRVFELMATTEHETLSAGLVSQMMMWVNLSWIRCVIDGVLAALLLLSISKPAASNSS